MRIRLIHPEFFSDPTLASLSDFARLVFIGLWLIADREGRLVDNAKMIDGLILPLDARSCKRALAELATAQRIRRYLTPAGPMIQVVNFLKYQHPHPKEKPSQLHGPVSDAIGSAVEVTRPSHGKAADATRPSPSVINTVTSDGPPGLSQRNRDRARVGGQQKQRRRVAADAHAARGASAPVDDDLVKKVFG